VPALSRPWLPALRAPTDGVSKLTLRLDANKNWTYIPFGQLE